MTSNHNSLLWSPTQEGYVQVRADIGRLFYLPHRLPLEEGLSGSAVFAERTRRPHRIHVARVHAESGLKEQCQEIKTRSSISLLFDKTVDKAFGKLADRRGNTRRRLKSLIATSPDQYPEDPLATARTEVGARPRRPRSWLGKRRATLIEAESTQSSNRSSWADSLASNMTATSTQIMAPRPSSVISNNPNQSLGAGQQLNVPASARIPEEKPLASGNGVSVGISLAEPVLFLQGFEQAELAQRSTAMLRGSLHLKVTKPTKIKTVSLRFKGQATTKWPEGIPPKKQETEETDTIMSHTWPFFNAQFPAAEFGPCADHVELKRSDLPPDEVNLAHPARSSLVAPFRRSPMNSATNLSKQTRGDHRRLSLQVNQARSFGKGEAPKDSTTVAQKGYRTFAAGDYIYNFEFPLDSHIPETIDVELGSVKYELEATIERAGAFKTNLVGTKEVVLIRTPAEGSLEQVEPIAISRNWEDQLHYDIVISGKSFPLGAQVPIAFKLTPLAKVQCHRIKVFVTENIEYYCSNKRVHRMGGTRKLQLFEKRADGPSNSTFPGSSMRILTGGGLSYDQRQAAARGDEITVDGSTNLLGDLESGSPNIGPTEMEFNVQLPSCVNMQGKDKEQKLHFDTTYQNIQVHHWIKIVMRLSRPDAENPARRRHFEISIDSPFHVLSCRATQANIALPAYSSPQEPGVGDDSRLYECGCPGAAPRSGAAPSSYLPTLNNLNAERDTSADRGNETRSPRRTTTNESIPGLPRPQAAHVPNQNEGVQRPIHLLRVPSFNPPAFEDEQPPPPVETPPPMYETIASPTSGLADYFSRLSDAYDASSDQDGDGSDTDTDTETGTALRRESTAGSRRGRLMLPLTPGGRIARSMDEQRTWTPVGEEPLQLAQVGAR